MPLSVVYTGASERDPIDDGAGDAPLAPVVELGGGRMRVSDQVLDLFDGHVLAEQIRDHHDAEAVRGERLGETRGAQAPLEQLAHAGRGQGPVRERSGAGDAGPPEGRRRGVPGDPGR